MIAFHGKQEKKDALIAQLESHYALDEIVKGVYWENGKGCAVGCTVHSGKHSLYASELGIPEVLARLEDCIFERARDAWSKEWPLRFIRSIRCGADLSFVQWNFLHWIITDESVSPGINHPDVKDAISNVAALLAALSKGDPIDELAAWSAAAAAESAARTARSARSAAYEKMGEKLLEFISEC